MNMSRPNARAAAAKVLQRVIYQGESLSTALPETSDPLTRDCSYGCLRWHEPLSAILAKLLAKPLKNKDRDVACLLRVGLYQIIYQNTPDHAAVNETVKALKSLKKPWAKNLVNGVMRNFLRHQQVLIEEIQANEAAKHAFPLWLIDEIKKSWPDKWQTILLHSNQRAPMTLRVNLQKGSRETYLAKLKENGMNALALEEVDSAIILQHPVNVGELPGFFEGYVSVQDAAAQMATVLLDLGEGMSVLDACAAPGGKTGHILESAQHLSVMAVDSSDKRLKRVSENLHRLGFDAELHASDAADVDSYAKNKMFDRILLDAPCSASGVIRRHPDIKVLRRPADIKQLQLQQKCLLEALWPKLKPGGILLYATCSVLPQENEHQISEFIQKYSNATILPIPGAQGNGRQLFPGENSMDGFYFATLCKSSVAPGSSGNG